MKQKKLALVGCGKMATALVRGVVAAKVYRASEIIASDISMQRRRALTEETHIDTAADNTSVVASAPTVILAVKPQVMKDVLEDISDAATPEKLFISIAAGITTKNIEASLPAGCRVVRVMPNTPCLVQAGAAAFALGAKATQQDGKTVQKIFSAVGSCFEVAEQLIDAVTGLSGSGPAYVSVFMEALADGGVRMGLPRNIALCLAAQTVLGAAKLVLETETHPAKLKDDVSSPGGTTIAGLHALERSGFRAAVINAVEAATLRSRELSGI